MDEYLLGHSADEEARLRRQPGELAPDSEWLLDRLDLQPGHRAIDIGCGPQGILDLLSERVGPGGRVVGLERSEPTLALARDFAAERHLSNVEVVHGDIKASRLPRASFDLAHARLVLVNVPEPQRVVDEMAALVRPGGVVASHEADWFGWICDPPSNAWNALLGAFDAYSSANGIDLAVGRKTHRMLRAAGLIDVQVRPVSHTCPSGHPRRKIFLEFLRNVRERIIAQGAATDSEFTELTTALSGDLDDPGRLVCHLYFQAWGRKPC